MSKKGTYNGPFFTSFATRLHGTSIRFGTLVGTPLRDGQRDLAFAAATPPEGEEPLTDVVAHLKSKAGPAFSQWAVQHALMMKKMLPGGLEPCGCFIVAAEAAAKDLAPLLQLVLKNIAEALVLTVDPDSKKLSFWQYSGGAKPALRPAQLKADPQKEALLLWTSTLVDVIVTLPLHKKDISADTADTVALSIADNLSATLNACTCGIVTGDGASLRVVDFKSESSVDKMVPKGCSEMRVDLLRGGSPLVVHASRGNAESESTIRLRCFVTAAALAMRRDMELREAVELVRKEVVSSVSSRLQFAIEEADTRGDDEEDSASRENVLPPTLQMPWRALFRPQDVEVPMWCGEFCMPDETAEAARERLSQLLGMPAELLEAAPSFLDEKAQLERDYPGTYSDKPLDDDRGGKSVATRSGQAQPMMLLAALVAFLALLVPVFLLFRS